MKPSVPGLGTLFESVEGFMEFTYKMFRSGFNKIWWLKHVNVFLDNSVEEGSEFVQLVNWLV